MSIMKARIKFRKFGVMRFIGHLDVMRYFQKAFRRAGIAVSYSQGFSPHQIMSFASPLGIGLSSDGEYLDIVLEDGEEVAGILDRINAQMNEEIRVRDFTLLEEGSKTSMAVLAACDYMIGVKPGKESFLLEEARRRQAVERFCHREDVMILKKTKRSEKMVDIWEYIYQVTDCFEDFQEFTGTDYGASSLEGVLPVLYMQLTAGSVVNIKPELVLEALFAQEEEDFRWTDYQVHRLEMYGDIGMKKGEVHTRTSEIPCQLVPLGQYGERGTIHE